MTEKEYLELDAKIKKDLDEISDWLDKSQKQLDEVSEMFNKYKNENN